MNSSLNGATYARRLLTTDFDPTKPYSGVRMQQGRVQLDADWNERMDILMHRLETEVADFIGPAVCLRI